MAASARVPSKAENITRAELVDALRPIVHEANLDAVSIKETRQKLAEHFGLAANGLDARKGEVRDITTALAQEACEAFVPVPQFTDDIEDIGEENAKKVRQVYLVTFPHPKKQKAENGIALKAPSSYTKQQLIDAMLDVVTKTQGPRLAPLRLLLMAIFREQHAMGDLHDHLAVLAATCFRFGPLKRKLLEDYGLATHWSCSHHHYATCIAYCYLAAPPKKLEKDLDRKYVLWAPPGEVHPPLEIASRPPVTAAATAEIREKRRHTQLEKGKAEKFEDIDLWPIVIRENIAANANAPELLMAYAKRCGGNAMVTFCFRQWPKLQDLVSRCWSVERVEAFVERAQKSRMQILHEALGRECTCGGQWLGAAKDLFTKNCIDEHRWCQAVLHSLAHGRSKGSLVCHAGRSGNKGKSFLLQPLEEIYGEDAVFSAPPKGGFPLLNLERCRLALLDDWRFNEDIISYNLQLLWFEGKPIVIARPQNQFTGHLKYTKDDPIFITTLGSDIVNLKGKKIQGGDVEVMLRRLVVFDFTHQLEHPVKVPACPCCFARLLLERSQVQPEVPLAQHLEVPPKVRRVVCTTWTVEQVGQFLGEIGLAHLAQIFETNAVDGEFLGTLSAEDLTNELGCTGLQARKILMNTRGS